MREKPNPPQTSLLNETEAQEKTTTELFDIYHEWGNKTLEEFTDHLRALSQGEAVIIAPKVLREPKNSEKVQSLDPNNVKIFDPSGVLVIAKIDKREYYRFKHEGDTDYAVHYRVYLSHHVVIYSTKKTIEPPIISNLTLLYP